MDTTSDGSLSIKLEDNESMTPAPHRFYLVADGRLLSPCLQLVEILRVVKMALVS